MDLKKVMESTQPIEFEFLGEINKAEIYTAGMARLTNAQIKALRGGDDLDDNVIVQQAIGVICKSWDVTWGDEPLDVESLMDVDGEGKLLRPVPAEFVKALFDKAESVLKNPTKAEPLQTGSAVLQPESSASTPMAIQ